MAITEQKYPAVKILTLSREEKLHLIVRLSAQLAQANIQFSDGSEAIPHDSILQLKVVDEHGVVSFLQFE